MKLKVIPAIPLKYKGFITDSFKNKIFIIEVVTLPFRVGFLKRYNMGFSPIGKN
jgi:hypothetical protein